jgi:arylsulfatase A-like enzyme
MPGADSTPPRARRCAALACGVLGLLAGGCAPAPQQSVDLAALLGLAEVESETEAIDFGTPGARAFLLEGFGFNERSAGGMDFVWGLAPRSALRLVVGEPRDLRLRLHGWPAEGVPPESRLEVRVAGEPVGEAVLRAGPAWYGVLLPGALLVPGENRIELHYAAAPAAPPAAQGARAVALERLEIANARSFGLPERRPGEAAALRLPFRASLTWYWMLPRGGELGFATLAPWSSDGAAGGRLEVEVQAAGESEPARTWLAASGAGPLRVKLPAVAGAPVRVRLRAAPEGEAPAAAAGLDLVAPVLRTPQAPPEPRAAAAAPPRRPPHVFVYLIDTLRADHLGAYGYPRPTSPHIDAFAREAARFANAVAQTSWTRPAVASLFTGLHPPAHGVVRADRALAPDLPTLPEVLQGLGYQTWGIVTNGNVAPAFGFGRGFERYHYLPERHPVEMHQLSDRVNELAFDWLAERNDERPLFFYLHTSDPHSPYTPRAPFRERLAPEVRDPGAGSRAHMRRLQLGEQLGAQAGADVRALYDAEIAFNDASFGAFLEKLRELDLYADSLIVLLSDHGESFAEHGSWQHGTTLYGEVLEIPLVIRLPGGRGSGRVLHELARQVDLLPTLLDLLGREPPAALEGRSLLPLFDGGAAAPVTAFAHLARRRGEWESALHTDHKLIRTRAAADGAERVRLYDLAADPLERRDLAARDPVWRGYLLSQLAHQRARPRREEAPAAAMDPELRERLRALGYL